MRRVFLFPKHSKRHGGAVDFHQEVAKIFTVDFGNIHKFE